MLILDFRTQTIKDLSGEDLAYMAPELYVPVQENNSGLNGAYKYTYELINDPTKRVDWTFTNQEIEPVGYVVALNSFLKKHNLAGGDVRFINKLLYLNRETILKVREN